MKKRTPIVKKFKLLTSKAKSVAFKRFGKKYRSLKSFSRAMSSKRFYAIGVPVSKISVKRKTRPARNSAGVISNPKRRSASMARRKRRVSAVAPAKRRRRRSPGLYKGRMAPRFGKHRPVLFYTRQGWKRHRKGGASKLFLSPVRLNRRKRKYRVYHWVRKNRRSLRRNPVYRMNRRRRYTRRYTRRNPIKALGNLTSQKWLMTAAKIGGGIGVGAIAMPIISNYVPGVSKYDKYLGIAHVVLGAFGVSFLKNKDLKDMSMIIAGTGVYDLIASNVPQLGLKPLPRQLGTAFSSVLPKASLSASYTSRMMPVSPVAAAGRGMSASYGVPARAGYSASYPAPGMKTQGLSSDNPYEGIEGWE